MEVYLHEFLTSALDGGEWSALRPGGFIPRERAPGTQWIGGWVGHRAVLYAVVKRIASTHRESNPRSPIVQPVAQRQAWPAKVGSLTTLYQMLTILSSEWWLVTCVQVDTRNLPTGMRKITENLRTCDSRQVSYRVSPGCETHFLCTILRCGSFGAVNLPAFWKYRPPWGIVL
jgi:hypothetical protein